MKKTFLAFAGTAALVSVLTAQAGDSPNTGKLTENGRKGRRREFTELSETEKSSMQEAMAESLSAVLHMDKSEIMIRFKRNETLKDIILASKKDEATVKASLESLQEARMMTKIKEGVLSGKLTQTKADEIVRKIAEGKKNKEERRMYSTKREYVSSVATLLNITEAEVVQSLKAGMSPVQIAMKSGMDELTFRGQLKIIFKQNNNHMA